MSGLLIVAFSTLLERKMLGLSQIRLGPNKVSFLGVLQPVRDGVKLLRKYHLLLRTSRIFLFVSPALLLGLFLFAWAFVVPWSYSALFYKNASLMLFCALGIGAYAVILVAWGSFRAFAKLGSLRGILQSLSFEVALIITFLLIVSFFKELSFSSDKFLNLELRVC